MGQLNIPDSSTVYVDTSVIIYSVEKVPDYDLLLEPLWQKLQTNQIRVFSSELTLLETLVLPLQSANMNLVNDYEQLLLSSNRPLAN